VLTHQINALSTAVARLLDVLASHPTVQEKLREEIRQYLEGYPDDSHYDGLLELPYLDGVVRETLRLYGPFTLLTRE
jgi:cytochrome P450